MVKLTKRLSRKNIEVIEFRGKSGNGGLIQFVEDSDGVVYVMVYDIDDPEFVQIQTERR